MSDMERRLCKCIADLMNGREPDWFALRIPKEMRAEILRTAQQARGPLCHEPT